MLDNCGCNQNDCEKSEKSPEEKVEDLKKAIEDLGYKTKKTGEGEIKISE